MLQKLKKRKGTRIGNMLRFIVTYALELYDIMVCYIYVIYYQIINLNGVMLGNFDERPLFVSMI